MFEKVLNNQDIIKPSASCVNVLPSSDITWLAPNVGNIKSIAAVDFIPKHTCLATTAANWQV